MAEPSISNLPDWQIIKTLPDAVEPLITGLSLISDPELGYSIIQLGLVRDIVLHPDHALVTMILTTPYCPYGPSMMESARNKVESILKIPTKINYGAIPWETSMMDPEVNDNWGLDF